MVRKVLAAVLAALAVLVVALFGAAAPASAATTSPLTCTIPLYGYYGYAVSGTVTDPNLPTGITVVTSHIVAKVHYSYTYTAVSNVTPVLDNTYASGYYLGRGYNAWNLGLGSDHAQYWLLLPSTTMGGASVGQIVGPAGQASEGNCTAPLLPGNTGAFTCSAAVVRNHVFYTVTGTIVAPENPTRTVVTRNGVVVGSNAQPVLDNTYGGGYWLTTYGWNSWPVTWTAQGAGYWLLIPGLTLSRSFSGLLTFGSLQLPATCSFT